MINFYIYLFFFLASSQDSLQKYVYQKPLMGTTFSIIIYHDEEEDAQKATDHAFKRIEKLNQIFSNYLIDSEASRIHTTPLKVSNEMWEVLTLCKKLYQKSNGAFDITIGPVSKLWRQARRRNQMPSDKDIKEAKALVGFNNLVFNSKNKEVSFKTKGMMLDFGAIAKGYAVDEAYMTLMNNGIKYALVDGGGDIYAGNHPDEGWKVNIQNLDTTIYVNSLAIASSGSTYQNLTIDEKIYSHIIHPTSAIAVKSNETMNIIGPSCTVADALATIISINPNSDILQKYFPDYVKH